MVFDSIPAAKDKWVWSMIFLRIPKCASSSIISCLKDRNLVWKHRGLFAQKLQKLPIYKGIFDTTHASPSECYQILGKQVFDYFSFTVVREPIQRLISAFFFGKQKKLWPIYNLSENCSFEEFVDFLYRAKEDGRNDILILRPQVDWADSKLFKPTVILKFEELQKGWQKMIEDYEIKELPLELPWENRSAKETINISAATKKLILTIYEKDRILYP
jgi:hypothetical protein